MKNLLLVAALLASTSVFAAEPATAPATAPAASAATAPAASPAPEAPVKGKKHAHKKHDKKK